jgi:hypothetical protein
MSLLTEELRKFGYKLRKAGAKVIRYAEKLDERHRQRELDKARAAGLTIDEHGYLVIDQEQFQSRKYKEVPGVEFVKGTRVVDKNGNTRWTMMRQTTALLDDED